MVVAEVKARKMEVIGLLWMLFLKLNLENPLKLRWFYSK